MRKARTYIIILALLFALGVIIPIIASTGYGPGAEPVVPPFVPIAATVPGGVDLPAVRLRPRANSVVFTTQEETIANAAAIINNTPRNRRLFVSLVNPGEMDAADLNGLFIQAANNNIHLILQMDTVDESTGALLVRVFVDAMTITQLADDVELSAMAEGAEVNNVSEFTRRYFRNDFAAINIGHEGAFGIIRTVVYDVAEYEYIFVRVAVNTQLLDFDTENLVIYALDTEQGHFAYIDSQRRIDAHGFLHFYTPVGGTIILSDNYLVRR